MSSDIFDTKKIQYCVGVEFPSLPESKRALIAVDERKAAGNLENTTGLTLDNAPFKIHIPFLSAWSHGGS